MSDKKSQRILGVLGKMRDDLRKQSKLSQGDDRKALNEQARAVSLGRAAYLAALIKEDESHDR